MMSVVAYDVVTCYHPHVAMTIIQAMMLQKTKSDAGNAQKSIRQHRSDVDVEVLGQQRFFLGELEALSPSDLSLVDPLVSSSDSNEDDSIGSCLTWSLRTCVGPVDKGDL